MSVTMVEHPFDHRPRHLRKSGHEMMPAQGESGYPVVRVRDDFRALWELAHREPLRCDALRVVGEARPDLRFRIGMQAQPDARRARSALPCMVIGRRADTAEAEHGIITGEGSPERCGDEVRIVPDILAPTELQAARPHEL